MKGFWWEDDVNFGIICLGIFGIICPLRVPITRQSLAASTSSAVEFERNLIAERTQAGLLAARARGRLGGRPKALDADRRKLAVELYNEKKTSVVKICQVMGISKPILYSYVRESQKDTDTSN